MASTLIFSELKGEVFESKIGSVFDLFW